MSFRRRILTAFFCLPLAAGLAACSDSVSTDQAAPTPAVEDTVELIDWYDADNACEEELESQLFDAGYYPQFLTVDFDHNYEDIANPSVLHGTFSGWDETYQALVEGTASCAVEQSVSDGPITVDVSGEITQDGSADDTGFDYGSGSSTGGSAESLATAPSTGQQSGLSEYRVQPRVDSWEPELADYLIAPGQLVPGGAIYNLTSNGRCSVGHFATDSTSTRVFILTAGHCGDRGSRWAYQDPSGQWIEFGETVERAYSGDENLGRAGAYDIGIIEVTNPHARWSSVPPVTGNLKGSANLDYVAANAMALCRIGSTDGLSCGNYLHQIDGGQFEYGNQSRPGDSGGAIYAVHPNGDMYAVGIASYSERDAQPSASNWAGGMEIWSTLQHFGLSVF